MRCCYSVKIHVHSLLLSSPSCRQIEYGSGGKGGKGGTRGEVITAQAPGAQR